MIHFADVKNIFLALYIIVLLLLLPWESLLL